MSMRSDHSEVELQKTHSYATSHPSSPRDPNEDLAMHPNHRNARQCKLHVPILAYLVGAIATGLFELILMIVARINISNSYLVIGVGIGLCFLALCCGALTYCKLTEHSVRISFSGDFREMKYFLIMVALISIVPAFIGAMLATNCFHEAWYYEALTKYPTQSSGSLVDPLVSRQIPPNPAKAIRFSKEAYVDINKGGYGLFWDNKGEEKVGAAPEKVICVAPIVTQNISYSSTQIKYWAVNFKGCCRGFPTIDFTNCHWKNTFGALGADPLKTDDRLDIAITIVSHQNYLKYDPSSYAIVEWLPTLDVIVVPKTNEGTLYIVLFALLWPIVFLIIFFCCECMDCLGRNDSEPINVPTESSRHTSELNPPCDQI